MGKGYNQRNAKVDGNQKEIVDKIRKLGAKVIHVHTVKKFTDIIVLFRGCAYFIEIKDGRNFPDYYKDLTGAGKRIFLEKKLTDGEAECMDKFKSASVPYHIVSSFDEALSILNK